MSCYQNLFALRQLGYLLADKREFDVVCFICEFGNTTGPLAFVRYNNVSLCSLDPLYVILFTVWIKVDE
jgi:hypothetical protein